MHIALTLGLVDVELLLHINQYGTAMMVQTVRVQSCSSQMPAPNR